ncbi:amidase [Pigmentiphaga sp. H8]|uniref:amidase family protein n=1 Tax=Pigmentiphaga sp. H8 TaxID=2488560 RepID=UPI000F5A041E|nr:amidase family protein [Pigmentiphaga sp. H8]AZG11355.1 amidase [Pigmentiphaga sp. H8]
MRPSPSTDVPLHALAAAELAALIRARRLSAEEATRYFIDRIERHDGPVNAVPVRDFERALACARQADVDLARGDAGGPLHGVPMTVKESFFVQGLPTCMGEASRAGIPAVEDSVTIRNLKRAGAIILGKSNVPLMCGDWQSSNDVYGETHNPWRHGHSPGGSSGGSAAALAAGLTPLELGNDRAGSIRVPASFCGVYGHKPTWGAISGLGDAFNGQVSPSDIGTAGPMATNTGDLEVLLRALAVPQAGPRRFVLEAPRAASLKGYRVAVWCGDPAVRTSEEITSQLAALADDLAPACKSVTLFQPFFDTAKAREVYGALRVAAVATGKSADKWSEHVRAVEAGPGGHPVAYRHAKAALMTHREWSLHDEWRNRLRAAWSRFFEEWDILICPATLRDPFPIYRSGTPETRQLEVDGRLVDYYDQEFWPGLIGMCYLPATAAPLGLSRQGLPLGMQVVAAEGADYDAIRVAGLLADLRPAPALPGRGAGG